MKIVNFLIPVKLDKRIKRVMRKKGIATKTEFFRFAAIYFLDIMEAEKSS